MSGRRAMMIAHAASGGAADLTLPLTLTATAANSKVTLKKSGSPTLSGLQYRMGTSGDWSAYTTYTTLTLANIGDAMQFRNTADTLCLNSNNRVYFTMTGGVAASGNLMSMLNWREDCPDYCFLRLFQNCPLYEAPLLPATTLGVGSYQWLFYGCTPLTRAPLLPAPTVPNNAYYGIFYNCSKLNEIDVSFTTWNVNGTDSWLYGVAATGIFRKPAALPEKYATSSYFVNSIPAGWTVVNK